MRNSLSNKEMISLIQEAKKKAKKGLLATVYDKSQLSTEEKFKVFLCRLFVQHLNEHQMKPKELHEQTGIEQSRISEIIHYKISKFTIDKLLSWLNILAQHSPKIREHLLFLEEAMSMPVLSVKKTRKLTSDIRKVHSAQI